jgi:hypothetical protein
MAKTVFDVLVEKINDRIETVQDSLVSGTCQDFAVYKEQCGVIHGLALARREVQDLARHIKDDDD